MYNSASLFKRKKVLREEKKDQKVTFPVLSEEKRDSQRENYSLRLRLKALPIVV
jgi:hypothetical protein